MKRGLTYLLAVIMVLLSGCVVQPGTDTSDSTADTVSSQPGNTETAPDPTASASPQEYYFLCPEFDLLCNLSDYPSRPFDSLVIPIISRTPIDPDQVEVVLPLEHIRYQVFVGQATPASNLDFYLYKCYENWDWAAEAKAKHLQENKKTEELTKEEKSFLEDIAKKNQEIMERYFKLSNDNLPGSLSAFYCYTVLINFNYSADTMQEETVSYMDVSWPGVSFRQVCGSIRFYFGKKTDYGTSSGGVYKRILAGGRGGAGVPYGFNHGSMRYRFVAQKDMVLEKLSFLNKQTQLKHVIVKIQTEEGNMNFQWDGQTPVPVNASAEVDLRAVFTDPRLEPVVAAGRITARLDYSCDGEQGAWVEDLDLERGAVTNWYELAAIYFDGVDVPRYYREYYNEIIGPKQYQ